MKERLRLAEESFLFVHAPVTSADKIRNEWSCKWFLTQMLLMLYWLFYSLEIGCICDSDMSTSGCCSASNFLYVVIWAQS